MYKSDSLSDNGIGLRGAVKLFLIVCFNMLELVLRGFNFRKFPITEVYSYKHVMKEEHVVNPSIKLVKIIMINEKITADDLIRYHVQY